MSRAMVMAAGNAVMGSLKRRLANRRARGIRMVPSPTDTTARLPAPRIVRPLRLSGKKSRPHTQPVRVTAPMVTKAIRKIAGVMRLGPSRGISRFARAVHFGCRDCSRFAHTPGAGRINAAKQVLKADSSAKRQLGAIGPQRSPDPIFDELQILARKSFWPPKAVRRLRHPAWIEIRLVKVLDNS